MSKNKKRNAEATKETILQAAERLFAEKGFAGTTLREISEAGDASGPLIVFHFKDKKGVYEAVKAAIIRRFSAARGEIPPPEESFRSFLEHILRAMFRFYRNNPTMLRLANWGRLESDVEPWPGEEEWHHACWDRISQAQQRGEIRDDLTPLNISIFICGAVHIWWEYHEHFLEHAREKNKHGDADEFYLRQCLSFVQQGLSDTDVANTQEPSSSQPATKGKRRAKRPPKP